jgi:tetratricopeptide (TPR) repeat protein
MPYLQHPEVGAALRFARSDHSVAIPRPGFDAGLGIAGACAQCHRDRSVAQLEAAARDWWGEFKPRPPLVAALTETAPEASPGEGLLRLLRPDLRHSAAQERALAQLLEEHLVPDMTALDRDVVERLRRLAVTPELDVSALALAALHLAQGERRPVRRFLAARLRALGALEHQVRDRWRVILGYLGDRYQETGQSRLALRAYAKALEVAPEQPAILLAMGLAHARAGDQPAAVEYYRRSLRADPVQPLAHINLGVALEALGDLAGATAAYRAALAINPREALAWFNLANGRLRAGDLEGAVGYYREAIDADRGFAAGHANLARAYGGANRLREALVEAQWALELAPGDPSMSELVRQIEALAARR